MEPNATSPDRPVVVVCGATGYLGRHVVKALHCDGWHVRALARNASRLGDAAAFCDEVFIGHPTDPATLEGLFDGADAAFSSIGVRSFKRRPTFREVDQTANLNLVDAAERAGVIAEALASDDTSDRTVGGPDILSQRDIAAAAFDASGQPQRVTRVPSRLVHTVGRLISPINPNAGANLQMFAIMGQRDMVGDPVGTHHLTEEFNARCGSDDPVPVSK